MDDMKLLTVSQKRQVLCS